MTSTAATTSDLPIRWRVAAVFFVVSGTYAAARAVHEPAWPTDFDQLWFAARAMLAGDDPYAVVGPGRLFNWLWPLYYPLPAVLYTIPFTVLPVAVARVAFSAVAAGALGWAVGARARVLWPMLLSAAYIISISRTQWAPLLLAVTWMPALGFVVMAKPNVGLAALATLRGRTLAIAIAGCAIATAFSFLVRPDWFVRWRDTVAVSPHVLSPLFLPGGFLLTLAVLRWRRPEARLLLASAVIPHTPSLYDLLLLFFACRTVTESVILALLTQALYWGIVLFGSFNTFDLYASGLGGASIFVVYLPTLLAILLRPNRDVEPQDARGESAPQGWRAWVPESRLGALLLGILIFVAAMLIWLPLVTYR